MNMIYNKEPERHEIEALLPWHAAGTLNRRDADRVERAIASDHELARRFDLVREELAETIHLNETLGAPSARAMERLFASIDVEEARAPRRARSFDFAGRISELLSSFSPRTLAWSASAAVVALLLQAAVITSVVMKDQVGAEGGFKVANFDREGSFAKVRFAPQATATDIANFLGAYKAKVVDGPVPPGSMYRIQLSEPKAEVPKIVLQMQQESRIVSLVAAEE
jgi:anti-sigma-K factor RskA